ncbi:hypothetical protein DFA_06031 [Cavenderia fasciculata]|uniref:Uncharacterized protein n=1 Tax=Cavenderia fasciculata TaxID=261658 RepID=F4PJW9_CACFS|nr:uncharacterized protein DFA_06031 [Cavenderia fasciculata]EGG23893.1 hypothetical protein DFA_06031 [Cavenderia fasciculata]|eukprot:XP_004361744.1 hypothetical protein DFA_06031 [Cavenderia fasciculata]
MIVIVFIFPYIGAQSLDGCDNFCLSIFRSNTFKCQSDPISVVMCDVHAKDHYKICLIKCQITFPPETMVPSTTNLNLYQPSIFD